MPRIRSFDAEDVSVRRFSRWLLAPLVLLPLATATPTAATSTPPVFAVTGYVHGSWTLMVGHLGGSARTILRAPSGVLLQQLSVSPDGRRVSFIYGDSYGVHLAVVDTDGTHGKLLTKPDPNRDISTAVWSPEGKRLYFGSYDMRKSAPFAAYVVPSDGTGKVTALPDGANADPTSLSVDGKMLAFGTMVRGERYARTGVMNVNGTSRHRVGGPNLGGGLWRPRSNLLAVSRVLRDSVGDGVTIQVELLNVSTGKYRALSATQSPSSYGAAYPVAWSRDGRWLYYLHYDYRNGTQVHQTLYRIRVDGTGRTNVTPHVSGVAGPYAVQAA